MKNFVKFVCVIMASLALSACFKDEAEVSRGEIFEIDMDSFGLISVDSRADEVFIPVKTNMGYGWSVESADEWCHVERVTKSVHGISVTVEDNSTSGIARRSRITARGGSEEYRITVIQR